MGWSLHGLYSRHYTDEERKRLEQKPPRCSRSYCACRAPLSTGR